MIEEKNYLSVNEGLFDFRSEDEKKVLSKNDRRDGKFYYYTKEIILAVNVALATGRPLLIKGPSGSGKSSLAFSLARRLERKYYEVVITSQSQAKDLLWTFDAIKRLANAQYSGANPEKFSGEGTQEAENNENDQEGSAIKFEEFKYVTPGQLWWAIDPATAKHRGYSNNSSDFPLDLVATDPADKDTLQHPNGALILLDEIDKAEPDFANNLLVPLGSTKFHFDEIIGHEKWVGSEELPEGQNAPLIIITTNNERRLPTAFMRRCIVVNLESPENLIDIAIESEKNFLNLEGIDAEDDYEEIKNKNPFLEDIYQSIIKITKHENLEDDEDNEPVNLAVYLDTVRAFLRLKEKYPDESFIDDIAKLTSINETFSI